VSFVTAILLACACTPTLAGEAAAQPKAPAAAGISSAERLTALDAIAAAIQREYVFPEKTAAIVARLDQARRAGRYDLDDPSKLASTVTEDLLAASGDKHLYLRYDPAQYAAAQRSATKASASEGEDFDAYRRR